MEPSTILAHLGAARRGSVVSGPARKQLERSSDVRIVTQRIVKMKSPKSKATAILVGGVLLIAIVAGADGIRGGGGGGVQSLPHARDSTKSDSSVTHYPHCGPGQLALAIIAGGFVVLRHLNGGACRIPEQLVTVSARGTDGKDALAPRAIPLEAELLAGTLHSGVTFTVRPIDVRLACRRMSKHERVIVSAHSGPYSARRSIRCELGRP